MHSVQANPCNGAGVTSETFYKILTLIGISNPDSLCRDFLIPYCGFWKC